MLAVSAAATAQDRVVYRSETGAGKATVGGTVIDWTGESLRIRSGEGVRTIDADRVIDVESPRSEPHIAGLKAFAAGKYDDARKPLADALSTETRVWVRRDILAALVRTDLARGDRAAAGAGFLAIVDSDPATRYFPLLPLEWRPGPPDASTAAAARGWLAGESETARLLGASVLLFDPTAARAAKDALDRLAVVADRRIFPLARAQLWRLALGGSRDEGPVSRAKPNEVLPLDPGPLSGVPPAELDRWEKRIGEIPEPLRGGAYYLVGLGRRADGDHERAAAALLWLPLVYDSDPFLAAEAEVLAAEELSRIGRTADAVLLQREVRVRFPQTPAARRLAEPEGGKR